MPRHFEDFVPGAEHDLGSVTVTEEEIVAFATDFDPQPFHTDPEAARNGPFGGLVASGWHTGALFMRLYVRAILRDSASMGSPGIDQLRFTAPVRPGDTLHGRFVVEEVRPSARRADRGTVHAYNELRNDRGEVVLTFRSRSYLGRRPAQPASDPSSSA